MANILDYLDWRGDLSFEQSPFNEVDGLILAQLSYVFFDGILTEDFDNILTLSEVHSRLNFDSIDEKLRFFSFDYDRILLQKMANSKRFGNMPLTGYVSITDPKNEVQFAALTCILDDKTKYISYRGTDASIVGWREDFNLSYMTRTAGQKYAVDYLNRHFGTQDDMILGGHSKGGNFAIYAAVYCNSEIQPHIKKIFSFDGPGFRNEIANSKEYRKMLGLITSIVPKTSIVGQLMTANVESRIVLSIDHGFMQHLTYNWQVLGKKFEYTNEFSSTGKYINKVMQGWLSELDDNMRQEVFTAVFDVLDASESTTFTEMGENKRRSTAHVLKAIAAMSPEKQKATRQALKYFLENSKNALLDNLESSKNALLDNLENSKNTFIESLEEKAPEKLARLRLPKNDP